MLRFKGSKFLVISCKLDFLLQMNIYAKLGLYIDDFFHYICGYIVVGINLNISSP
jgi:hypothetical protein